jgi:hypothetical protein
MSQCTYRGHFTCSTVTCIVGRPFLIEGTARVAEPTARTDWHAHVELLAAAHDGRREQLARAWTEMALMEHASIAAFARFTLQLLALGAPPDMIERSNAAQADETRHARLCFAIAGAYAGHEIGPGALRLDGALPAASLESVLVNVIREGCIGETLAALEAAEAREHATEPAVRDALTVISHDELRHAELAWHFVRWALAHGGSEARCAAAAAFQAAACDPCDRPRSALASMSLLTGGILPDDVKAELRDEAMLTVILPCARRMLSQEGLGAPPAADHAASLSAAG